VLLVVGTLLVLAVPGVRTWFQSIAAGAPAYVAGESIDVRVSLYDQAQRTLIIFARSSCASCQRAKPLLVQVVSEIRDQPGWDIRMMATASDDAAELEYAHEIGLEPSAVTLAPRGLRLSTVPTIVVVDRQGLILFSQEGLPDPPFDEQDFVRSVTAAGRLR
jgi:thioredoxin-related protein